MYLTSLNFLSWPNRAETNKAFKMAFPKYFMKYFKIKKYRNLYNTMYVPLENVKLWAQRHTHIYIYNHVVQSYIPSMWSRVMYHPSIHSYIYIYRLWKPHSLNTPIAELFSSGTYTQVYKR